MFPLSMSSNRMWLSSLATGLHVRKSHPGLKDQSHPLNSITSVAANGRIHTWSSGGTHSVFHKGRVRHGPHRRIWNLWCLNGALIHPRPPCPKPEKRRPGTRQMKGGRVPGKEKAGWQWGVGLTWQGSLIHRNERGRGGFQREKKNKNKINKGARAWESGCFRQDAVLRFPFLSSHRCWWDYKGHVVSETDRAAERDRERWRLPHTDRTHTKHLWERKLLSLLPAALFASLSPYNCRPIHLPSFYIFWIGFIFSRLYNILGLCLTNFIYNIILHYLKWWGFLKTISFRSSWVAGGVRSSSWSWSSV